MKKEGAMNLYWKQNNACVSLGKNRLVDLLLIFFSHKLIASFHQFHKYYIYGHFDDCAIEKQRVKDCFKWRTSKSMEAKVRINFIHNNYFYHST